MTNDLKLTSIDVARGFIKEKAKYDPGPFYILWHDGSFIQCKYPSRYGDVASLNNDAWVWANMLKVIWVQFCNQMLDGNEPVGNELTNAMFSVIGEYDPDQFLTNEEVIAAFKIKSTVIAPAFADSDVVLMCKSADIVRPILNQIDQALDNRQRWDDYLQTVTSKNDAGQTGNTDKPAESA